jgi:NAD-dependent SIR2 family protein deacetylase
VIANAKPNASHFALAQAESLGRISHIITQNVDSLHQQAGSRKVTELHGRLDKVICMTCRALIDRLRMDDLIEGLNPAIRKDLSVEFTPDGDAEVEAASDFRIPPCPGCGGILKPDVVFFGESVPTERVASTMEQLERAEALLVAGSSLTVNSGMRFARAANKSGKPIVIVNVGPTRADEIALAKIEAPTSVALEELLID